MANARMALKLLCRVLMAVCPCISNVPQSQCVVEAAQVLAGALRKCRLIPNLCDFWCNKGAALISKVKRVAVTVAEGSD